MDAGPLIASVDADDHHHDRCRAALSTPGLRLVIPTLLLCETIHVIGERLGARVEARFVATLAALEIIGPSPDEWSRLAQLVEQYRDVPLGSTDASVVALAERLHTDLLITLDRRHFGAIRPRHISPRH